jgi:hypothetical protein
VLERVMREGVLQEVYAGGERYTTHGTS